VQKDKKEQDKSKSSQEIDHKMPKRKILVGVGMKSDGQGLL